MGINDFLAILNRRKWVIILTAIITLVVVIAGVQVIPPTYNTVIMTSKRGQVVKLELSQIPRHSRNSQGVKLMRFSNPTDLIASATCVEE